MKLLLTSILHRVAPHKSMLTLLRPSSCLGTTKQTKFCWSNKTPYSPLASMCSSSRPKMQGVFLLFDEALHVFNVHFLIVILQNFRFNSRGLETNVIDWKTIEKHIHCDLQMRQMFRDRALILAEYKFSNCSSKSLFTNVSRFMSSPELCCAVFTAFVLDNANLNYGVLIN